MGLEIICCIERILLVLKRWQGRFIKEALPMVTQPFSSKWQVEILLVPKIVAQVGHNPSDN